MDEMPADGFRHRPRWLLAVAGLLLAQVGLALALFGPERSVAAIGDDRPILSGRHPLHLYHGTLGAQTFRDRGATNCYDPNFQSGYPKTPVFDGGCRPAELFLTLAGGDFHPAAYKAGLFACLLAIPLAFVLAGRGVGLPAGAAVLAGAFGTVIGWSWPVRRLIEEGDFDFIMAGLGAIVFVAWLGRYARAYGLDSWAVLAVTAAMGWYAHPVLWVGLVPVVIGYYLVFAPQRELAWHLGLAGVVAAGLAPNLWWLTDWTKYWWLRQATPGDTLPQPTWGTAIGSPSDYFALAGYIPYGGLLTVAGVIGLVVVWRKGCRGSMGLMLASTALVVAAARMLAVWPHVPGDAPERLAPLAAGFLALPAAFGLWKLLERGQLAAGGTLSVVVALLVLGWVDGTGRPFARTLGLRTDPLVIGFSKEQLQVIEALEQHTTPDARILWDETTDHRPGWNWTALLPLLTGRSYIGGLDHDAGMEYSFCAMQDGQLNGRPLSEWTDTELEKFCGWYNVGWVVCRSTDAADRWGRVPGAKRVARLTENEQPLVIYSLDRKRSFVLSGSAVWEDANPTRITLSDVTPDADGYVTLSLHYMPEIRAYPSYVRVESVKDESDPQSHVRLRPFGPVPRVTLVWENP